ncbi:helix-turn-helix domain-containing protein [Vibrio algarum]|uniref:XRE family transcriptional regulator n=1 Tax=Vibrio algarum TaxID=3020714 RepID=A0ABT4YUU7_9VIBR|nr:XRE family transcriptional regulator [Vibrio sp. KJ40-1]MDB1125360.1 XRE family transcriptional regulator [Vibrio sp. KJ40-1]
MEISFIIAHNLKKLRNERNLSLGQLAKLSGISKVVLSQIEKGESNPTINTIWKIAGGLNVAYTLLLELAACNTQVVSRNETVKQSSEDGTYQHFCYYPNSPVRNFELFQIELAQGGEHYSHGHPEKSEEYILVSKGELELRFNGNSYKLTSGEAITFDAAQEHTYVNAGKEVVIAIVINYYP